MAPISNKRRRNNDEPRKPKKKIRKVHIDYHSSSDESENEDTAFDAPKVTREERAVEILTGSNAEPKSILKRTAAKAPTEQALVEAEADEDGEEDELERNTALNSIPPERELENGTDQEVDGMDVPQDDEPDLASSDADSEEDDDESLTSSQASSANRQGKKRNDPTAFATSIAKILDTKLTTAKRSDPVLSRSKSASEANKSLADTRLESKARAQLRAERRAALEKGRVKDVLGLETEGVDTGAVMEQEKQLKKTAQRGVVRLFNAVRAAQVKGEEAMAATRKEGTVGLGKREERVREMSKQGFLDLISSGAKKGAVAA